MATSIISSIQKMKVFVTILFHFFIISSFYCLTFASGRKNSVFNVVSYGAIGDGKQDDSQAFLKAWKDVCGATGAIPTLLIPAGKTFLLKPLNFLGPCKSKRINVQLSGTLVAPYGTSAWGGQSLWIHFSSITNLCINGGGKIDGRGYAWWGHVAASSRPTALHFHNCPGLLLTGITHLNSPKSHVVINKCQGVDISHLHITAPEDSPNTDGIDISASTFVNIHNCQIGTGDDCIAISGFSAHINISNILCGPGHGISVGSLGRDGAYETVEEVHVLSSKFKGTQNGVRIKTWQGGSGYARKISFENIEVIDAQNPIIIDQNYVDRHKNGLNTNIKISDVTYWNISGSSGNLEAIQLNCSANQGCTNIAMDKINITSANRGDKTYASCKNVQGRYVFSSPIVPCLNKVSSLS